MGYVALAIRIVEQLGFVKDVTWRLSIPALARMQQDQMRTVRAITEGITLQTMAAAVSLVGFSLVAPWIIPVAFGSR